jgi:uncharacterized protein (TIGR02466 family)
MLKKIHNIFPVKIREYKIENYEDINKELLDFAYSLKKAANGKYVEEYRRTNRGGFHSRDFSNEFLKDIDKGEEHFNQLSDSKKIHHDLSHVKVVKKYRKLVEKINNEISEIVSFDILNLNSKINSIGMWMNINPKGGCNGVHHHGDYSCISGVYYIKVPKNSAAISFTNPFHHYINKYIDGKYKNVTRHLIKENFHDSDKGKWKISQPEEGSLLVFDGWMPHSVDENKSDEDRVSISFNFSFEEIRRTIEKKSKNDNFSNSYGHG